MMTVHIDICKASKLYKYHYWLELLQTFCIR